MTKARRTLLLLAAAAAAGCQQQEDGGNNQAAAGNQAAATTEQPKVPPTTIGEALRRSPEHSTLVQALTGAGLHASLAGSQPYTLFAPTNAAFQKLPGGGADLLKAESKGQLTTLLTGHIVPGVVTREDLARAIQRGGGKIELATVGGARLTATARGDEIVVGDPKGGQARVTAADRIQSNGVIHSIDTVLTPG